MSQITELQLRRPTVHFFGTDCLVEKMAHNAIEHQRIVDENAILRANQATLQKAIASLSALDDLHAIQLRKLVIRCAAAEKTVENLVAENAEIARQHTIMCDRLRLDSYCEKESSGSWRAYR